MTDQKLKKKGKRVKMYKRAMYEHFSPYIESDGLILRKSFYSDLKISNQIKEENIYKNREDCLQAKNSDLIKREVIEDYRRGREDCLKLHKYRIDSENKPETDRVIEFFDNCRADGLYKLIETPDSITEHFSGREDKLYYREVIFGERPKKFGPAGDKASER